MTASSLQPVVRMASDGTVVVLEIGAEGGSVTLVGRKVEGGEWRFARITDDQTEALFGESGEGVVQAPSGENREWVDGWEAGLRLMDRYPWAQLYPLTVHPEFVERVRVAVEEQLATEGHGRSIDRTRRKWERLFGLIESGNT